MTNITDYKRNSMQTVLGSSVGNIDDLEIAYLQAAGATSNNVNDAWYQVFVLNGATSPDWNGAANQFLIALGAIGSSLADRWAWFWITNAGVITPAYDPLMMSYDGSTGYYLDNSITYSGNKMMMVASVQSSPVVGTGVGTVMCHPFNTLRILCEIGDASHPTNANRGRFFVHSSSAVNICDLYTNVDLHDGNRHCIFFAFDGDTGSATLIVDGANADDTGHASRVAPTTGVLETLSRCVIGSRTDTGLNFYAGKIGFIGYADQYATNYADFMDGSSPKELDTTTWTEWGSQPLFWNDEGDMDIENLGSAGLMTKNGTITGPA